MDEKLIQKQGCMTHHQIETLKDALITGLEDPSLLSDLEGCGPVKHLEESVSRYLGVPYTLAVSSCTAALHTALLAMGIGPGDEVIVSPYTWPQSVSPVLFTGATPVFADINNKTLTLDPESVERNITERTKAIIPVHLFGQVADIEAIGNICNAKGILIISDSAQAFASRFRGKTMAQYGDCACFSLGRGKLVCGGEGGILATRDGDLYKRALILSQHLERVKRELMPEEYTPHTMSLNYRIHPISAVLAIASIQEIGRRLEHRRKVREALWYGLGESTSIIQPTTLIHVVCEPYGIPATFVDGCSDRDELIKRANIAGIPLRLGPIREVLPKSMAKYFYRANQSLKNAYSHQGLLNAEYRCAHEELWILSTLDMDIISPRESFEMGKRLARIL